MKVVASLTYDPEILREGLFSDKRGQALLRMNEVQAGLRAQAVALARRIRMALAAHRRTGRLMGSVDVRRGTGKNKYRYFVVVGGKGVPYALVVNVGRSKFAPFAGVRYMPEGFFQQDGRL